MENPYRHLETDRWADLEVDPTDAVFSESFSDLPWDLREAIDFPSMGDSLEMPIEALTL